MDSDTMLPPPDPDEPFVVTPIDGASSGRRRHHAVVVVAVLLLLVAAALFAGRLTTSSARAALGDERDSLLDQRRALESRIAELEQEATSFTTAETEYVATIEGLKSSAAATQVELSVLREQAAADQQRIHDLESAGDDLWERLDGLSECRAVSDDADAALSAWDDFFETFLDYLEAEVGSDVELELEARLDQAGLTIDEAERALLASETRCESALDAIPECGPRQAAIATTDDPRCQA
jgi:cell division septum initiation protein DivIVA